MAAQLAKQQASAAAAADDFAARLKEAAAGTSAAEAGLAQSVKLLGKELRVGGRVLGRLGPWPSCTL